MPLRIANELPPSYRDCLETLASKSSGLSFYAGEEFERIDSIMAKIDDDEFNRINRRMDNRNDDEENVTEVNGNNAGNNATTSTSDANGNLILSNDDNALEMINGKGVIKLDMSRIIDPTGLPTYEAALKLKSSSYI